MRKSFFPFIISCLFAFAGSAQYDFKKVDDWMNANTNVMGGRAILMVYKDGKIVYTKSVNDLSTQQKWMIKTVDSRYCAFLMTMYIKSDGRNARYKSLKALVDEAIK